MDEATRRVGLNEALFRKVNEEVEGLSRGLAEISALADVVLTHYADHRFVRTTAVDAHHGFARYGWDLTGPDGTVAVSGTDVVVECGGISTDGL